MPMFKGGPLTQLALLQNPQKSPLLPISLDMASSGSNPQAWLLGFGTFVFIVLYLCARKGASRVHKFHCE